ncbi:hypothetical protein AYI70_g1527 [Smittium culicis]|uniref:Uncharacterized protein n=1 Tax=Smittium culicis TaxID=133412 RepID=A0A1R1YC89_9FUNG|nr:hypothetical protein AYI70_g1527 [Smittium culicis]
MNESKRGTFMELDITKITEDHSEQTFNKSDNAQWASKICFSDLFNQTISHPLQKMKSEFYSLYDLLIPFKSKVI